MLRFARVLESDFNNKFVYWTCLFYKLYGHASLDCDRVRRGHATASASETSNSSEAGQKQDPSLGLSASAWNSLSA
eukprot:6069544-Amphidinium_carterae.1